MLMRRQALIDSKPSLINSNLLQYAQNKNRI